MLAPDGISRLKEFSGHSSKLIDRSNGVVVAVSSSSAVYIRGIILQKLESCDLPPRGRLEGTKPTGFSAKEKL